METEKAIQEYKILCRANNLSGYGYYALLSLLKDRLEKRFYTEEEIMSDFSVLENAMLLKQLLTSANGMTIIAGGASEQYGNASRSIMIGALVDYLDKRIQKRAKITAQSGLEITDLGANMILNKGYGGGGTGRAYLIPYPPGVLPQEEGYSIQELDTIIGYESIKQDEYKAYIGNKQGGKHSLNPMLGHISEWIIDSFLPKDWILENKLYFVFNYLACAGYLDHKQEAWKFKNIDKGDIHMQGRAVRSWIEAYHRIKVEEETGEA